MLIELANTGAGQPSLISPCSGMVSRIRVGFSGKVSPGHNGSHEIGGMNKSGQRKAFQLEFTTTDAWMNCGIDVNNNS